MADYADLIERLEKATEGSEALDIAIAEVVGWPRKPPPVAYSRSLDAALSLVPEGWFFSLMHAAPDFLVAGQPAFSAEVHGPVSWVRPEPSGYEEPVFDSTAAEAATPALALVIAALKARQAAS